MMQEYLLEEMIATAVLQVPAAAAAMKILL